MTAQEGIILWKLLAAHLLTDFVFQPTYWIKEKNKEKEKSKWLYVHGTIAGVLSYIVLPGWSHWLIALIIGVTHIIIDTWKSYRNEENKYFIIDQLAHIIIIFLCWIYLVDGYHLFYLQIHSYWNNFNAWVIGTSYLLITYPFGILIGKLTKKWKDQIENIGLDDAGKWIGILERVIILTLVLMNQYEAIGLLIAAKSILRFPETRENSMAKENEADKIVKAGNDSLKRTEYVLIGTLISFGFTIVVGLIIKALINIK